MARTFAFASSLALPTPVQMALPLEMAIEALASATRRALTCAELSLAPTTAINPCVGDVSGAARQGVTEGSPKSRNWARVFGFVGSVMSWEVRKRTRA